MVEHPSVVVHLVHRDEDGAVPLELLVDPSWVARDEVEDPCCGEVDHASCEEEVDHDGGFAGVDGVVLEEDVRGGVHHDAVVRQSRLDASQQRLAVAEFAATDIAAIATAGVEPE